MQVTKAAFGYWIWEYPRDYTNQDLTWWRPTWKWAEFTARRIMDERLGKNNPESWLIDEEGTCLPTQSATTSSSASE